MRTPRITSALAIVALVGTAAAACGDGGTPRSAPRVSAPRAASCSPARTDTAGTPAAVGELDGRRDELNRAIARATASGHRFVTDAVVEVVGAPSLDARLAGRRLPDNTSSALLKWRGATSLILPDAQLRIVRDRIFVRRGGGGWEGIGSASGIALDVGRELLDHPFLLRATSANRVGAVSTVTLAADGAALRAYAGAERRGLATDLLVHARSLRITVRLRSGRLAEDQFRLITVLPTSLGAPFGGRVAVVVARTAYCPLSPADRSRITAPATAP